MLGVAFLVVAMKCNSVMPVFAILILVYMYVLTLGDLVGIIVLT